MLQAIAGLVISYVHSNGLLAFTSGFVLAFYYTAWNMVGNE